MTPEQFVKIQNQQLKVIENAEFKILTARTKADKSKPPIPKLRRATADDIKRGKIIWNDSGDDGWFWNIVSEPLHYGDDFKAYTADDGCRYGLQGAWVMR